MIPGKRRNYIQVGNEIYSLQSTDDNTQGPSLTGPRRNSADNHRLQSYLEEKNMLSEQRENRKKELEQGKRHLRQIEATVRYKDVHFGPMERNSQLICIGKKQTPSYDVGKPGAFFDKSSSLPIFRLGRNESQLAPSTNQNFKVAPDQLEGTGIRGMPIPSGANHVISKSSNDDVEYLHGRSTPDSQSDSLLQIHSYTPSNDDLAKTKPMTSYPSYYRTPNKSIEEFRNPKLFQTYPTHTSMTKPDITKAPIRYYVKAYRPWSANATNNKYSSLRMSVRPSSSYEVRTKGKINDLNSKMFTNYSTEQSEAFSKITTKNVQSNIADPVRNEKETSEAEKPIMTPISSRIVSTPFSEFQNPISSSGSDTTISESKIISPTSVVSATKQLASPVLLSDKYIPQSPQPQFADKTPPDNSNENTNLAPENNTKTNQLKGILRRTTRYGNSTTERRAVSSASACRYHSAAFARSKWVNGITRSISYESDKSGNEQRPRRSSTAEPKAVRWHEVQYNDGTSSALGDIDGKIDKPAPPPVAVTPRVPVSTVVGKQVARASRPGLQPTRPKSSPPQRGTKGKKGKAGKGRKLKPSKEVPQMDPIPPPTKTKQLSISTALNYSIDGCPDSYQPKSFNQTPGNRNDASRKAWSLSDEIVTMDNLKSTGNAGTRNAWSVGERSVNNQGDQVTITISRGDENKSELSVASPVNYVPTEKEICMLWDKVQACLVPKERIYGSPLMRRSVEGASRYGRKNAWGSSSLGHVFSNIISINKGMVDEGHDIKLAASIAQRPNSAYQIVNPKDRIVNSNYHSPVRHRAVLKRNKKSRSQNSDLVIQYT